MVQYYFQDDVSKHLSLVDIASGNICMFVKPSDNEPFSILAEDELHALCSSLGATVVNVPTRGEEKLCQASITSFYYEDIRSEDGSLTTTITSESQARQAGYHVDVVIARVKDKKLRSGRIFYARPCFVEFVRLLAQIYRENISENSIVQDHHQQPILALIEYAYKASYLRNAFWACYAAMSEMKTIALQHCTAKQVEIPALYKRLITKVYVKFAKESIASIGGILGSTTNLSTLRVGMAAVTAAAKKSKQNKTKITRKQLPPHQQ